jgi:predicted metal-dependent phosphoesterase TrpH
MSPAQADLHTHTICSDGTFSPEELVRHAGEKGLAAIAVSDHDSVAGIPRAMEATGSAEVEIIPAIELSAESESQEIHILGYFIDYTAPGLLRALGELVQDRVARVHAMIKKLHHMGVALSADSVFAIAAGAPPGRMHIAQALMQNGYVASLPEAFTKYIGDRAGAYVCGFRLSPKQAIGLLRGAGGVAVLAHPYLIKNDALIPELVAHGLSGLEVYYPEHTQSTVNFYLQMARRLDLAVTGGSDFHGQLKPDVPLGSVTIPYELVDALRRRKP